MGPVRGKKRRRQTEAWLRSKEGREYLRALHERPPGEAAEVRKILTEIEEKRSEK